MKNNKNILVFLILILLAGLMIFIIRDDNHEVNRKFTNLINRTFELSFADEQLIRDCKSGDSFHIHGDILRVTGALENLVKAEYETGKLLSIQTFCKMYAYNMLNNTLIDAGDAVCSSKALPTLEDNSVIKRDLLPRLNEDNLAHHSYFSDDSLRKYHVDACKN